MNHEYYEGGRSFDEEVSVVDWVITFLILAVPLVNIVMFFIWAFSSETKPSKANFFKAQLVIFGIMMLLVTLLVIPVFFS